ncbi:MAG: DMT family transporter [Desulfobacterota bacterium]|nr:DMT family transporter [Thermodesulfobacteriota bacterium]MDW8001163.1 DMT family transporter [Deltaproteobacteria bacterium]
MGSKKDQIDVKGFFIMLILTLLWGLNYSAIKISNTGFSPIFNSFLRSSIASIFGIGYCLKIRQPLFHKDRRLLHGFVVGCLFGLEFVFIYLGLLYTDSTRAGILINFSPIIVALGAYIFLKERLTLLKILGLILSFFGVFCVFQGKPSYSGRSMLIGDILELLAAFFWGATTLYIKKYLAEKVHPINTFLYQLVLSVPILFGFSLVFEERWVKEISLLPCLALIYSSVIVAFLSYLSWFRLIHTYPVSELAVFTFLSPVFGVFFGSVILGEELTKGLIAGLVLVSAGIYLTNCGK